MNSDLHPAFIVLQLCLESVAVHISV